jgi:hypothetical protein
VNRNVWDPSDLAAGSSEMMETKPVVELSIYFTADSQKDETQARQDWDVAKDIWCQAGINIQVSHWERLSGDADLPGETEQIPCDGLSGGLLDLLFQKGHTNRPSPDEDNDSPDPLDHASECIPVIYMHGDYFAPVSDHITGCEQFRWHGSEDSPEHIILLTDRADGRVLAHELGHALFARHDPSAGWIGSDPDPHQDPADKIHNKDPHNLMFHSVPQRPEISPEQSSVAQKSRLVSHKPLVYGITDNKPYKLKVSMDELHVSNTDDAGLFDDDLESHWRFTVNTGVFTNPSHDTFAATAGYERHWDRDGLGAGNYDIRDASDDVALEVRTDRDDILYIWVHGLDQDDTSFDDKWDLKIEHPKGVDFWGASSTSGFGTAPSQIGQHRSNVLTDDDITFDLEYTIKLYSRPTEQVFRVLC